MNKHKIIKDNLNETTSIINEDSSIHEEVLDIFREAQKKGSDPERRARCNFYSILEQETGENYELY